MVSHLFPRVTFLAYSAHFDLKHHSTVFRLGRFFPGDDDWAELCDKAMDAFRGGADMDA